MGYRIEYACISHIGNCRSINQDNFICTGRYMELKNDSTEFPLTGQVPANPPSVFGIFDGMGGEYCGEVAAFIASQRASELSIGKDAAADLYDFCMDANERICKYAEEHDVPSMGTTAAMLAFTGSEIVLCNIGDSKIFRLSGGNMEQISKDHTEIAAYGKKAPLYQNLGIPATELVIEPYFSHGKYQDGDVYLICSDGLTDMVTNEEIQATVEQLPFQECAGELLKKALENGGKDNTSIILCKVQREPNWIMKLFGGKQKRDAARTDK
ncbi:MAG: serine/threonine-protein phosphatase [Oscillospiraceae bacterium]|nr:serine/threonine-protein phosphatase [Oscillospiraceae bacterium]